MGFVAGISPSPRSAARGFARVLVLASAFILAGCGGDTPRQRVRLTEEPKQDERAAAGGRGQVLRIGVASVLSPPASLPGYRELIGLVGERLGVATEMVQRPNYAETNELLRQEYCQVGFLCNYAFIRARREFGAELLASPVVNGSVQYRAYIIAGRDSSCRSVLDLAGKRFAFADPMCNAGWLYPLFRVTQLGRQPRGFFGAEIFTHNYGNSIRAVADAAVEGAGVESPLYDSLVATGDPFALRTRIVDRSPPLGTPPVVVHPRMDPELRDRLRALLLSLHEDDRGREILGRIQVDRFVAADPDLYAPVSAMAEAVERP